MSTLILVGRSSIKSLVRRNPVQRLSSYFCLLTLCSSILYWDSFCSILVITVDSKECEVILRSFLDLVLMSPHVRANTQRASRWILGTAVDAVLVNAVVTWRFRPGQCESCGVASTLRQSTGGGGGGGSSCGVKDGRDMHFNSAQEWQIIFRSYLSTTY